MCSSFHWGARNENGFHTCHADGLHLHESHNVEGSNVLGVETFKKTASFLGVAAKALYFYFVLWAEHLHFTDVITGRENVL
jgi:hypothetical protein